MINEEYLRGYKRLKYRPPVIYQPVSRRRTVDTSVNPDTSIFRESGVGLNDAERDTQETDRIKQQSTLGQGEGEGADADASRGGKGAKGDDVSEDDFSIFKIFKIVPIGINVLLKAPNLASGFADLMEGTTMALINASLNALDLFLATYSFSMQGFKFVFILLICMVENLTNLNACIIFYLIDLVFLIAFLVLFSVLKLVDSIFMTKLTGVSLSEVVMSAAEPIIAFDDYIHSISGYHLIRYPDYIIKRCYTCSVKLNKKKTVEKGREFTNVLFGVIPRRTSEPLDKIISAFRKFGSIFDL